MKLAFYISSAINVDDNIQNGFGHLNVRSFFNSEERFRQTQFTISNIRLLCPTATIFLFEIGKNAEEYKKRLKYVSNLEFISSEDLDPIITQFCRTSSSKGQCETKATMLFLDHYISRLSEFDYLIKISGRYFFTSFDASVFNLENTGSYLTKNLRKWNWKDSWKYPQMLNRGNYLYWIPTQTYVVGNKLLFDFYKGLYNIREYYNNHGIVSDKIDYECMIYHFVLDNKPLISLPWTCGGWVGQNGIYSEW